jgi:hypothetical protein
MHYWIWNMPSVIWASYILQYKLLIPLRQSQLFQNQVTIQILAALERVEECLVCASRNQQVRVINNTEL